MGYNYLSLREIPASGTKVLILPQQRKAHQDRVHILWVHIPRFYFNPLYPERYGENFKCVILQYVLTNDMYIIFSEINYNDVIMGALAVSNHQPHNCLLNRWFRRRSRKHQSSTSLAFVRGIHRGPVNSPHKWPVTRKMFPFDDVIMLHSVEYHRILLMTIQHWFMLWFVSVGKQVIN